MSQAESFITAFAGTGVAGYSGDGGPAGLAQLNHPEGLAFSGSIYYIADSYNHCIREINAQHLIFTLAGDGTKGYRGDGGLAQQARLNEPRGITKDSKGHLYIADSKNHVIRKITPQGIISTIAGNNTSGYHGDGGLAKEAQLDLPVDVAVDQNNQIYIADEHNHVIRKINAQGIITTLAGNRLAGYQDKDQLARLTQLHSPQGVVLDGQGNLYVADTFNHVLRKIDAQGMITTLAGNNVPGYRGEGPLAIHAQLNFPTHITIDQTGHLYVSDTGNYRIRKIDLTTHRISTLVGDGTQGDYGDGKIASQAQIDRVTYILVNTQGELYFSDSDRHRVRRVTSSLH